MCFQDLIELKAAGSQRGKINHFPFIPDLGCFKTLNFPNKKRQTRQISPDTIICGAELFNEAYNDVTFLFLSL